MPAIPTRRALAVVAAAAGVLAGCSTGVQKGDAGHAKAAVVTFLAVCSENRGAEAIDMVAISARSAFIDQTDTLAGCQLILGRVPVGMDPTTFFGASRVTAVRTTGDEADVDISGPGGWHHTVEAERTGDQQWFVTASRLSA